MSADRYGFDRTPDGGCKCRACGATFPRAEGSVMRSHARRVHDIEHHVPAVCDA